MTPKLVIPLIFALSTGTAVIAQDTTMDTTMDTDADFNISSVPFDWDTDTVDAFFSDLATGELHDEETISDNWADLSSENQELVRDYCEGDETDETGLNGTQSTTPATNALPGAEVTPETTGTETPGTDMGTTTESGSVEVPGADAELGAETEGTGSMQGSMDGTTTAGTSTQMTDLCDVVADL